MPPPREAKQENQETHPQFFSAGPPEKIHLKPPIAKARRQKAKKQKEQTN